MDKTAPICVPGQRLCLLDKTHVGGHGTYERHGYIYSCLAGVAAVTARDGVRVVEVRSAGERTLIPAQGDVVTARVDIVTQQHCKCSIKCIGDAVLNRPYRGVLRREDARAAEKDRVELYRCFRPGDVVLARVLPIGESRSYQLSTAESELGVVIAHSEAGYPMVPVSWTEMQCARTLVKQPRKVAKVVPENYGPAADARPDTL